MLSVDCGESSCIKNGKSLLTFVIFGNYGLSANSLYQEDRVKPFGAKRFMHTSMY